jgi:hypothetical protein
MTVRLVISIEGGLVQAVYTNNKAIKVDVAIVDYDVEGGDLDEIKTDDCGNEYISRLETTCEAQPYVNEVFEKLLA